MTETPKLTAPSFEQHPTGFGIGIATPRISWRFISSATTSPEWEQSSYELEIIRLPNLDVESYRVTSADSVLVPWPSKPLQSCERARVHVRVYGTVAGKTSPDPTDWSPWSEIECALLGREEWKARPITRADTRGIEPDTSAPKRPIRFRKTFETPSSSSIKKARLYITGLGCYTAYINGKRVGDEMLAPGWTSYDHRINYQVFDVADLLHTGPTDGKKNVVAVEVGEGWYATRLGFFGGKRCIWGTDLAVLAQLEVIPEKGELIRVLSDDSWKCNSSAVIRSEIYDGELYDAREEQDGWTGAKSAFDDSLWMGTRMLPFPSAKLGIPNAPPVRVKQTLRPVEILTTPLGKTVVDFGQNVVGVLRLHFLKKEPGSKVRFTHAEVLENGELGVRPLRDAKCVDEVITSSEPVKEWSPSYTFHGFRYVQVEGWSPTDAYPLKLSSMSALVIHTDMVRTGHFSCSHPMVNQLHENSVWSMRGNFLSVPTDCPQRDERLGWTGDIQIYCPSASFLYNTAGMLGDWLQDVASEQLAEEHSIPPLVIPNAVGDLWRGDPQAVWDDVTVLTPWALYQAFGDLEILRRQYQSMVAWVDNGVPRGPDGLWDIERWQLGDWLDPTAPPDAPGNSRTNATLVADAYLLRITSIIAQVSDLIGETANATRYHADHHRLKAIFQAKYIAPSGLIIGDTQTALSLAIVFSLLDSDTQNTTAGNRLAYLVRLAAFRVSTGFVGTPIITHALTATGHAQLAYRMLQEKGCPSWLYPITMGATTTWERWDSMKPDGSINGGEMTSFNHYALGSVINWLHTTVAGISPLEPGWRRIKVSPVPGGTITSAKASYESPYGLVSISWEVKDGHSFSLDLEVPVNTRALVILPGDGNAEKWVGSGRYSFSVPYVAASWPPKPIRDFLGDPKEEFIA